MPRPSRQFLYASLITGLLPCWVTAQQAEPATGMVTGRITEVNSQRPLSDVQVRVVGTQRGGITNDQGDYTLERVQPGRPRNRQARNWPASTRSRCNRRPVT